MSEEGTAASGSELPWSGGRPWRGSSEGGSPEGGNPAPDSRLCGTGVDLALALAAVADDLDGPELGAIGEHARARLVDVAVAAERVKAWAAAVQARAVADLHDQFVAEHDLDRHAVAEHKATKQRATEGGVGSVFSLAEEMETFASAARASAACLSLALGVSSVAADRLLAFALGVDELPQLLVALASGRVDERQARVIQQAAAVMSTDRQSALVASIVTDPETPQGEQLVRELRSGVPTVWSLPPHKLRPILSRCVAELAPEAVETGEEIAQRERRVEHYASAPGCSGALVLRGPDHLLAAAYGAVDGVARAARRDGAVQTLDQLRFDAAVSALAGGASDQAAGVRAHIDVLVPATMLLGLDDVNAARLRTPSGDVPISPGLARQLAHGENATWRRILCDPSTGVAVDVSPRYRAPARMVEYCKVRDGYTSRFPVSGARALELDHVTEYRELSPGGPTTAANLACTGKRDHQTKTDRLIQVSGDANAELVYRSGAGHSFPSLPHRYLDPEPDPREPDPPEP